MHDTRASRLGREARFVKYLTLPSSRGAEPPSTGALLRARLRQVDREGPRAMQLDDRGGIGAAEVR